MTTDLRTVWALKEEVALLRSSLSTLCDKVEAANSEHDDGVALTQAGEIVAKLRYEGCCRYVSGDMLDVAEERIKRMTALLEECAPWLRQGAIWISRRISQSTLSIYPKVTQDQLDKWQNWIVKVNGHVARIDEELGRKVK